MEIALRGLWAVGIALALGTCLPCAAQPSEDGEQEEEQETSPPADVDRGFRQPLPAEAALETARKVIGEVYRDRYTQAKTDEQKIVLANKLLEDAAATEDDPAGRFMMQRIARDIAIGIHDPETAFLAIDGMAERFAVDARQLKSDALSRMQGTPKLPIYTQQYVESLGSLYDEAIADDDYDQARVFAEAAQRMSRKVEDIELRKQITARSKQIESLQQAYADVAPARATLEELPLDPAANATVGHFLCFVKDDWADGIPMLALGTESELRNLARQELLLDETDPAAVAELGDRWWQLAEASEDASEQTAMVRRAAYWYEQAVPQLTGLTQAKVQRRLDDIRGDN